VLAIDYTFGRRLKADFAVLLPGGHGGNPDQEQAVLAKWEAKVRMANDPKAESAVAAGVFEDMMVGSAHRNAAKHERTRAGREPVAVGVKVAVTVHAFLPGRKSFLSN
jgi:hypothetical protein